MKRATVFLGALCFLAAFSGCADDGQGLEQTPTELSPTVTPRSSPTSTASPTSSPGSTTTQPPTVKDPPPGIPVANLTADNVNGSVPVDVVFTIDDSAEQGGTYNWTLEFGDGNETNGTEVPTIVEHQYFEIGEYVANLTLSNEAGTSNASINVTARDFAVERHSGAWETGVLACVVGTRAEWDLSDFNETSHVEFPVNNTTWNMTFFTYFDADGADSWMVDFYDEDGALVADYEQTDNTTVNGTVPQNATLVVLWACDPTSGGSAEYIAAPQEEWDRQPQAVPEEEDDG